MKKIQFFTSLVFMGALLLSVGKTSAVINTVTSDNGRWTASLDLDKGKVTVKDNDIDKVFTLHEDQRANYLSIFFGVKDTIFFVAGSSSIISWYTNTWDERYEVVHSDRSHNGEHWELDD